MKRLEFLKRTLAVPIAAAVGVGLVKKQEMEYTWVEREDVGKHLKAGWRIVEKRELALSLRQIHEQAAADAFNQAFKV